MTLMVPILNQLDSSGILMVLISHGPQGSISWISVHRKIFGDFNGSYPGHQIPMCFTQWVDLRENLQETMDFPMKYGIFLHFFPETNQLNTHAPSKAQRLEVPAKFLEVSRWNWPYRNLAALPLGIHPSHPRTPERRPHRHSGRVDLRSTRPVGA